LIGRILFIFAMTLSTIALAAAPQREFSFDLWDWTTPCRDLATFKVWARDLKSIGVTRLEISAPWSLLEPAPGKYDLTFITDRLAVAKSLGLGLRVRINSYYGGATPAWYGGEVGGDFWQDINGMSPVGTPVPPSIVDERFWSHYAPLCTRISRACKGADIYYSAFIGVHAELKWADWWSYDPATLALWRKTIAHRPQWLIDVAGDAPLPPKPPVPPQTDGSPDNSPVSKAWIAFREHVWRDAMEKFATAIRAGDREAKVSSPLGESFRRESAQMSNLDYYGLTRRSDQIVHSYDFYWHPKDDAWMAAAAVASFRGISGITNIDFEFDGPNLVQNLGYDAAHQLRIADAAMSQGAGIKAANYSYDPKLPSTWPVLVDFGKRVAASQPAVFPPPQKTILLFVSKWANYCYREKTEWLHDAQFGAWHMLTSHAAPVRFICEDNLDEDLSAYHGMYVAFSPPELMPQRARSQLEALSAKLETVIELAAAPARAPKRNDRFKPSATRNGRVRTFNAPLAFQWLRGDRAEAERCLREILRTWGYAE
jgi:hypothetical protein